MVWRSCNQQTLLGAGAAQSGHMPSTRAGIAQSATSAEGDKTCAGIDHGQEEADGTDWLSEMMRELKCTKRNLDARSAVPHPVAAARIESDYFDNVRISGNWKPLLDDYPNPFIASLSTDL